MRDVGATASETTRSIVDEFEVFDPDVLSVMEALGLSLQQGTRIDAWQLTSRSAPQGTPGEVEWSLFFVHAGSDPCDGTGLVFDSPANADPIAFLLGEDGNATGGSLASGGHSAIYLVGRRRRAAIAAVASRTAPDSVAPSAGSGSGVGPHAKTLKLSSRTPSPFCMDFWSEVLNWIRTSDDR